MFNKLKISALTLLLSSISALIQTIILSFVIFEIYGNLDLSIPFLLFFITFLVSFLIIYFIYNDVIFKKIENLNSLVKFQLQKEIPNTIFDLEEVDPITSLEIELKKLAQERQKELEQNRNIDSYRKDY